MKFKTSLLLVLVALLTLVPFAAAQDGLLGLSAEDTAILMNQNFDADSVSSNLSLTLSMSGAGEDISVQLTGSGSIGEDANGLPVGQAVINGMMTQQGESLPLDLEVIAVDGVLYYNFASSGWQGMAMDDAMDSFSAVAPLPVNPADIASGEIMENPEAMQAMGAMMEAMSDIEAGDFISISRLGDMDGNAHFQVNFDIQAFLTSDAFTSMMTSMGEMSDDPSAAAMAPMMAMMMQDPVFTIDEFISPADGRMRGLIINLAFTVDPAMMGDPEAEPISINFNLTVDGVEYDMPVSVTAPEGATMMPSS